MPITEVISSFPPSPDAQTDTPEQFSNKADAFVAHQADTYVGEVNNWVTEANALAANDLMPLVSLAESWAEEPEDVEVEAGQYSALHWSAKSEDWANAAVGVEPSAGKYSAYHWSNKSSLWAEEAEDVEVETGQYSALHWATKAINTVGITTPTFPDDEDKIWTAKAGGSVWEPAVHSRQEGGVGTTMSNALLLTKTEYDNLATKQLNSLYFLTN